jgi:hypothetical protein
MSESTNLLRPVLDGSFSGDELAMRTLTDLLLDADYDPDLVATVMASVRDLQKRCSGIAGNPHAYAQNYAAIHEGEEKIRGDEFLFVCGHLDLMERFLEGADLASYIVDEGVEDDDVPSNAWMRRSLAVSLLARYPGVNAKGDLELPALPAGLGWWLTFYNGDWAGILSFKAMPTEKGYRGPFPPPRYVEIAIA